MKFLPVWTIEIKSLSFDEIYQSFKIAFQTDWYLYESSIMTKFRSIHQTEIEYTRTIEKNLLL